MRYNIDQRAVQSLSSVKGIPLVHNINKCNQIWYLRFLMALTTKITVYWDVKACSLADKRKCATTRVNTYAAYSYQVLSKMYQITRHHIPSGNNLHCDYSILSKLNLEHEFWQFMQFLCLNIFGKKKFCNHSVLKTPHILCDLKFSQRCWWQSLLGCNTVLLGKWFLM